MSLKEIMTKSLSVAALALVLATGASWAQNPCNVPDNGTGTVTLPPAGCQYLSPSQVHMIIDGLPAGTTIILKPIHRDFICRQSTGTTGCITPGGSLGGETETFGSVAVFQVSGTGALSGFNRVISVPLNTVVDSAPRALGAPVQTFQTDMRRIQGGISGDPDFNVLQIVGGTANGFPSPGSTTLTRQSNGTFNVSSSFNVGYSIYFEGAPGSKLEGLSGKTDGTVKMEAFSSQQTTTTASK
jgi:hypothetical protein